jgi:hypothetical protein
LTLSDLRDDRTSVEPGSFGASKATHSSRPSLIDANESWRDSNSHRSSRSYDEMREPEDPDRAGKRCLRTRDSCSFFPRSSGAMGGYTQVAIAERFRSFAVRGLISHL